MNRETAAFLTLDLARKITRWCAAEPDPTIADAAVQLYIAHRITHQISARRFKTIRAVLVSTKWGLQIFTRFIWLDEHATR